MSITWKFQPNWSNNTLKSGFFRISGKTGSRIRNFFGLKPSRDQDGANKKKFSQIGPAVPEEIGHKHTNTQASKQTSCCYIREITGVFNIHFSPPFYVPYNVVFLLFEILYPGSLMYLRGLMIVTNTNRIEQKNISLFRIKRANYRTFKAPIN